MRDLKAFAAALAAVLLLAVPALAQDPEVDPVPVPPEECELAEDEAITGDEEADEADEAEEAEEADQAEDQESMVDESTQGEVPPEECEEAAQEAAEEQTEEADEANLAQMLLDLLPF